MQDYIQIDIKVISAEQSDILVAELADINFESFEERENMLSAFIKEEFYQERLLEEILSRQQVSFTRSIIQPVNWNRKWESEYPPVVVDNLVAIRAFFHPAITSVAHEILITPKMSFGTGHHATTFLMLKQMAAIDFVNKSVFDFGTGTGVLAIYAAKLGANQITAIDNDDWSIENAKENFETNNCTIELIKKDRPAFDRKFDIILANINLNVIKENILVLKAISKPHSMFIISGILIADAKELIAEFERKNIYSSTITEKRGLGVHLPLKQAGNLIYGFIDAIIGIFVIPIDTRV